MNVHFLAPLLLAAAAAALPAQDAALPEHTRKPNQTLAYQFLGGDAVLWLDPSKWEPGESSGANEMQFVHKNGMAEVRLIFSREGKSEEQLAEAALASLGRVDPKVRLIYKERRLVNGVEMLHLRMETTSKPSQSIAVWGYVYGDEDRNVRLFALVSNKILDRMDSVILELLDGLDVNAGKEIAK